MSVRDSLIHTLQRARRDWARLETTDSLIGFEVDAILAEFVVTERAHNLRSVTESLINRTDAPTKDGEKR